jgi:HD-GYP domain-containing protein (c-di-GMP phosphodiesterase class II)
MTQDSGPISTTVAATSEVASKAPHWAALILVVVAFLFYMDRSARTQELLAEQRIETCHDVQEAANDVLAQLTAVLQKAASEDALMRAQMRSLEDTMQRHTEAIEHLARELGRGR